MAALDHIYRYDGASRLETSAAGGSLRLASSPAPGQAPFFTGRLVWPRQAADLLLVLSEVVRSRYSIPPAMLSKTLALADPVITCHRADGENSSGAPLVRFEGFSGCCGVYARIDFLPGAVDPESVSPGTTNVDFGPSMRAALTRLTDSDRVDLKVGRTAMGSNAAGEATVEKKVVLPMRWLKGFVEVQSYQAGMELRFETSTARWPRAFCAACRDR